jgi:Bacterial Ig domain
MKKLVGLKETPSRRWAAWPVAVAVALALALVMAACAGGYSASSAGPASIRITAPADGATVGREFTITLDPSVSIGEPSTGRHHVHLYYDGDRSTDSADYDIAYDTSFTVTRLAPGEHTIEAVVANADHSLTDAHTEIAVTVSNSGAGGASAATTTTDPDGY